MSGVELLALGIVAGGSVFATVGYVIGAGMPGRTQEPSSPSRETVYPDREAWTVLDDEDGYRLVVGEDELGGAEIHTLTPENESYGRVWVPREQCGDLADYLSEIAVRGEAA